METNAIYIGGTFVPLEKIKVPERAKVRIKIEKVERVNDLKFFSYLKLLKEGEDARELFEF